MRSIWDRKLSEKLKEKSIENMKTLGFVLAEMCYTAIKIVEDKKGIPLKPAEMDSVMDSELNLIVEQNIEDEEWREMIFKMARDKYKIQKSL